jgi:hypothetical protein
LADVVCDNVVVVEWCFVVVVEAGLKMVVWRRRCWRGSAFEALSSNGETVHFEPLEIQRHQEAGFTLSKIQLTESHEIN